MLIKSDAELAWAGVLDAVKRLRNGSALRQSAPLVYAFGSGR